MCVSSHLAEQGYKEGKDATRKVGLMGPCALRDDWMGAVVRGMSVMDLEVSKPLCGTSINLCIR